MIIILHIYLLHIIPFCDSLPPYDLLHQAKHTPLHVNFSSHKWIQKLHHSSSLVVSEPLIDDLDADGHDDLVFTTIDGYVHFVSGFVHQHVANTNLPKPWSFHIPGQMIACSPVAVPIDDLGRSLVLTVTSDGALMLFDPEGNNLANIEIPNVVLGMSRIRESDVPITDFEQLNRRIQWFDAASHVFSHKEYRLQPRVFSTPLILPSKPPHSSATAPLYHQSVVVLVNFISTASSRTGAGPFLATVLTIPLSTIFSMGVWTPSFRVWSDETSLIPFELGLVHDKLYESTHSRSLPFLYSDPMPVGKPVHLTRSDPTHPIILMVATYNGHLFRISLPPDDLYSPVRMIWSDTSSSFPHACVPIDCPSPANLRVISQNLCCLLMDTDSCLRLIELPQDNPRSQYIYGPTVWTYRPVLTRNPAIVIQEQFSRITLVPGNCTMASLQSLCVLWAVYPTPDGFVHAVDVSTGSSVPGFPFRLFTVGANRVPSAGLSLLYSSADSSLWLLFTDTAGHMYHMQVSRQPYVLHTPDFIGQTNAFGPHLADTWIATIPTVYKYLWSPNDPFTHTAQLGLLMFRRDGVLLLTSSEPITDLSLSLMDRVIVTQSRHQLFRHDLFGVTFFGQNREPTNRLRLDPIQPEVHYSLRNCPRDANDPSRVIYAVQLRTRYGQPVSDWSIPQPVHSSFPHLINHTQCHGSILLDRSVDMPFHVNVRLHVLQTETRRVSVTSHPLLLEFSTAVAELVVIWTYLPFFYVLVTLVLFHSTLIAQPSLSSKFPDTIV